VETQVGKAVLIFELYSKTLIIFYEALKNSTYDTVGQFNTFHKPSDCIIYNTKVSLLTLYARSIQKPPKPI
jgi:hypothetical protein